MITLVASLLLGGLAAAIVGDAVLPLARSLLGAVWLAAALAALATRLPALDLVRHFPVAYAAVAAMAAAMLAIAGDRWWASGASATALAMCAVVAPWWRRGSRVGAVSGGTRLRVFYANVLTESRSAARLGPLIAASGADLVLLVEVDDDWLNELGLHRLGYEHAVAEPRDDHFGIAAYSRMPLRAARFVPLVTPEMPALSGTIACGATQMTFLLLHTMPPKGPRRTALRDVQLSAAAQFARTARGPFLLVGDLNATPWSAPFRRLVRSTGLEDARRGRGLMPTWPARAPWPLRLPIDHVLTRGDLAVSDVLAGPAYGSDHRPLLIDLAVGCQRGAGST